MALQGFLGSPSGASCDHRRKGGEGACRVALSYLAYPFNLLATQTCYISNIFIWNFRDLATQ